MRVPLVIGNWKMSTTPAEAKELAEQVVERLGGLHGVEVVLAPPFTSLAAVAPVLRGRGLGLGAQDLHWEDRGAFTGAISHRMLEALECAYVLVGHSERRKHFGESDHVVNRKTQAALRGGLRPVLCVGEEEQERSGGQLRAVIRRQVIQGLEGIDSGAADRLTIAYEPVWAIGTGKSATPEDAAEAHDVIRRQLERIFGPDRSRTVRILYGGSVTGENAAGLAARAEVDGVLVGGASLDAQSFAAIVHAGWETRPITG
jgi:triosephosphate isomerase (TIM)